MSADGIFLKVGESLELLSQTPYDSEAVLQEALAGHPEVIAGPTTSGDGESRLLLVRREMGVPSASSAANVFSLDHLFIDDEGVPVLVEVKRASDTRIRREVVGQMLDYAANAVVYWPLDLLRESLASRATAESKSVDELLAEFRPGTDAEEFWQEVEANLRQGRIRMIFAADSLPAELVRIIEFLNEQMNPAEVLGVELRQFRAGDHVAYVPSVVGRTTTAAQTKLSAQGQPWNRDSFVAAAKTRCSVAEMRLIERLFAHVDQRGTQLSWGHGVTPGVGGWYRIDGRPTGVWVLNANTDSPTTRAYLVFYFGDIVTRTGPARIDEAASKLERIASMKSKIGDARASAWKKYPSLYLADVASDSASVDAVFEAIETIID
ncbi:hypothetical protein [Nocardioides sp. KR10-350]|uniref:hypothetical protein n=1 Tax=Nocardioides cheoyonin TaxID=3156615 RepID=UPI0032B5D76F